MVSCMHRAPPPQHTHTHTHFAVSWYDFHPTTLTLDPCNRSSLPNWGHREKAFSLRENASSRIQFALIWLQFSSYFILFVKSPHCPIEACCGLSFIHSPREFFALHSSRDYIQGSKTSRKRLEPVALASEHMVRLWSRNHPTYSHSSTLHHIYNIVRLGDGKDYLSRLQDVSPWEEG